MIADCCSVTNTTTNTDLKNSSKKLHSTSRSEAVVTAVKRNPIWVRKKNTNFSIEKYSIKFIIHFLPNQHFTDS